MTSQPSQTSKDFGAGPISSTCRSTNLITKWMTSSTSHLNFPKRRAAESYELFAQPVSSLLGKSPGGTTFTMHLKLRVMGHFLHISRLALPEVSLFNHQGRRSEMPSKRLRGSSHKGCDTFTTVKSNGDDVLRHDCCCWRTKMQHSLYNLDYQLNEIRSDVTKSTWHFWKQ